MKLEDRNGEQEDILGMKEDQKHCLTEAQTEWKQTCAPVQSLLHPSEQEMDTTGNSNMSVESPNTAWRSSPQLYSFILR